MQDYELLDKIGAGAFGEVWKARDTKRNIEIAIKCLRLDRAQGDFVDFFKREFELLSELRHTYLAQVYDFGYWPEKEQYYFTTEFCRGTSLLKAVEGKGVAYFEEAFVQILAALDCIHSQGIVHFDIKPENVLVADDNGRPHVKLVDFGIASRLKSLPKGAGGTLAYMAPEILEGQKIDHRIDLYSLGILAAIALTGRFPFDDTDPEQVMEWHVRGRIPPDFWEGHDVPRYLKEIIEKLLAKNPAERFSSARVALNFLNLATHKKYIEVEAGLQAQIPMEGPLVERRESILENLQARLAACLFSDTPSPVPSVSFVSGERGIGKTRILEELRYLLELKEVPFLKVACDGLTPLWPKIANWLGVSLGEDDPNEEWQLKRRIDMLLESAHGRPFCLLIDDFHLAEREMRRLLGELSAKSERERAQGRPVRIFVAVATEEDRGEDSRLARLSKDAVAQYIRLVLGEIPNVQKIAAMLHQYSGGLPLLMVEGLRFLAPKIFRGDALEKLPVPQLDQLYREKIEALREEDQSLLHTLALLSRTVRESELEKILEHSFGDIARMAEDPLRQGLIQGGVSHTFGNRSVTYTVSSQALAMALTQSMDAEEKRALHLQIADGLNRGEQKSPQEIAHHLEHAGEKLEAIAFYRQASEVLKKEGQVTSATDCLLKAVSMAEEGNALWQDLILEASRFLILSGAYGEAESFLKRLETHPSLARDEAQGWLASKQRKFALAKEAYQRALGQVPPTDLLKKITIENALGNVDLQEGHTQEATERFRKTLAWESELSAVDAQDVVSNNLGLALSIQGDASGAMDFFESRLRKAGGEHRSERIALLSGMGYVSLMASRYDDAIAYLTQATELAERSGAMHSFFSSLGNLITAFLKEGLYAESLPLLQKMGDYQRRLGTQRDVAFNLLRQGDVYLTLGMSEAAQECFHRGRRIAAESGQKSLEVWFLLMDAYWEREFGSVDRAKEALRETETEALKISDNDLAAWAIYAQADLAHELGEQDACQNHFDRLGVVANDHEFEVRKDLLEGKLESVTATLEDIRTLFERIESHCLKNHFNEILWEAYHAWGLALDAKGYPEEAGALLEKGVRVVETIAAALPEEYRDRYMTQKSRRKLFADRHRMTAEPARVGFLSRIKQRGQVLRKYLHLH